MSFSCKASINERCIRHRVWYGQRNGLKVDFLHRGEGREDIFTVASLSVGVAVNNHFSIYQNQPSLWWASNLQVSITQIFIGLLYGYSLSKLYIFKWKGRKRCRSALLPVPLFAPCSSAGAGSSVVSRYACSPGFCTNWWSGVRGFSPDPTIYPIEPIAGCFGSAGAPRAR